MAFSNGPGYINTTDMPYMGVSGTKTSGQCCNLCAADSTCTHYTATSTGWQPETHARLQALEAYHLHAQHGLSFLDPV